jgi:hypothetical protein
VYGPPSPHSRNRANSVAASSGFAPSASAVAHRKTVGTDTVFVGRTDDSEVDAIWLVEC